MDEKVKRLVDMRKELLTARFEFATKHGFAYKRAQNFKNCIVIRWKCSTKKDVVNHDRIEEYVELSRKISDKYDLWVKDNPLLEIELRLLKANIYVFTTWDYNAWAIPNEYKGVQDYVLSKLPKWVKVSVK